MVKIEDKKPQADPRPPQTKTALIKAVSKESATTNSYDSRSVSSMKQLVRDTARKYGLDENHFAKIAKCESSFNPLSQNPNPVIYNGINLGHAQGLFQFIPSTWAWMSVEAGYQGASVWDPVANANVAAWAWKNGHGSHWECQ